MTDLKIECEDENFDVTGLEKFGAVDIISDIPLSAEIVFVSENEIKELNAETRKIDAVTDVLSFPTLDGIKGEKIVGEKFPYDQDEEGRLSLGSIVICRERAIEQANEYGHSVNRELYYLAVHGICHLLGYDHETDADKAEMREREEKILAPMKVTRDAL